MKTKVHLTVAFLLSIQAAQSDELTMLTDFGLPKSSSPSQFVDVNGTLFFVAGVDRYGPVRGGELWRSDGTTAGTFRIKNGRSWYLINVNGALFFVMDDETHGDELWKSDGTEPGTVLVKDINPGPRGSEPSSLVDVNGTLFFTTGWPGGLWKSDGTDAGTVPVNKGASAYELVNVNGTLYFFSDGAQGRTLWKSDGTTAGTVLVGGVVFPWSDTDNPPRPVNLNGTLYFGGSAFAEWLWKSHGTEAGTVLVKEISLGSELVNLNG